MTSTPLMRVFMNGGVVAPADLLRVLDASEAAGNASILFSARQDVLFPVSGAGERKASAVLRDAGLPFAATSLEGLHDPQARRNVVSSYAAVNVVETTWWLTEDVYQYTLANFVEQPRLRVRVVDPAQTLVPIFGGQVHFVASDREQYWHLYLSPGDGFGPAERCPGLIHGDDLPGATAAVEAQLQGAPQASVSELWEQVRGAASVADLGAPIDVRFPNPLFPYYEGLNAMLSRHHWLGLYWRNNRFDIPFLRAACELCQVTRVGKVSLTPWKSFIIKGIRSADRSKWEALTGAMGINLRHSSLELNWHIPVLDDEALSLKNELVSMLTMRDISTYGLTFTVTTQRVTQPFTSVVIEREPPGLGGSETYRVRHARDFDPNIQEYVAFASGVTREELPWRLMDLSRQHWARPSGAPEPDEGSVRESTAMGGERSGPSGHECASCLTVYDPEFGDTSRAIEPGVPFEALPPDYCCPVCSAGLASFVPLVPA